MCNLDSLSCSRVHDGNKLENDIWGANNSDGEMCQIDDKDDFMLDEVKLRSSIVPENLKVRKIDFLNVWMALPFLSPELWELISSSLFFSFIFFPLFLIEL